MVEFDREGTVEAVPVLSALVFYCLDTSLKLNAIALHD